MCNVSTLQIKGDLFEEINNLAVLENSMPKIVYGLLFSLPDQIRRLDGNIIEIFMINEEFMNEIIDNADMEVGNYLEFSFSNAFEKPYKCTLRELFLHIIIKENISYRNKLSYDILDRLIIKKNDTTNIFSLIEKPVEIKLSILMGHRFDGDEYCFVENHISKLIMRSDNISFFRRVTRMMRYLKRKDKDNVLLYIDYPQYYEIVNGEQLVIPYALDKLHRTSAKNCTYYSNLWIGSKEKHTEHSNAIMAILSFIKYCFERES